MELGRIKSQSGIATLSVLTHHDSVFLLARELRLVDVLVTVGLAVFRNACAFVLAEFVQRVGSEGFEDEKKVF